MRLDALNDGLKIAGAAAVLLIIVLFFPWYGTGIEGFADITVTAWRAFSWIDIFLFLIGLAVVGVVGAIASDRAVPLPVEPATAVTALGALAFVLILYRFLNTPGDLDPRYGLFLGLLASGGIAVGGRMAMAQAGASFSQARDDIGDRVADARSGAADKIGGEGRRYEDMSQEELYEEAQRRGIEGRSEMSKEELANALRRSG
jgi:hypothetical protein